MNVTDNLDRNESDLTHIHVININKGRLMANIENLAQIGKFGETGVCRLALSNDDKAAVKRVKQWMEDIGLKTKIDHFGNLIGRLEGKQSKAPVLMIGSHIDSQPYGGKYDGTIGVLGGLEVIQTFIENGLVPDIPIEVVAFCDEEGYRFGKGLFGSRGIVGQLEERELERTDENGMTRREALVEFGCNPEQFADSEYRASSISSYLEMHIEQGPVLDDMGMPIGIVTGIAGPLWLTVELAGQAGHAGSVPMHLRKDALIGAVEIIRGFHDMIKDDGQTEAVGTVGTIEAFPNSRSIIPETVRFTIDLRDVNLERRCRYEKQLRQLIASVSELHGLTFIVKEDSNVLPKLCSDDIIHIMEEECTTMEINPPKLMSGPFHDAIVLADICKFGMIFIRSKEGISHNPLEYSSPEDIAIGTELLFRTAMRLTNLEMDNLI